MEQIIQTRSTWIKLFIFKQLAIYCTFCSLIKAEKSHEVAEKQCETSALLLAGPTYSGIGATYYSSQSAIETDPSPGTTIAVENPHKLILEAPVFRVKDGDEFIIRSGARLRIYGKSVTCP